MIATMKVSANHNGENEGTDHDGDIRLVIMVTLVMTMITPVDIITMIIIMNDSDDYAEMNMTTATTTRIMKLMVARSRCMLRYFR